MLSIGLLFGRTLRHDFVNMDDNEYVCANPHIVKGLSGGTIVWAFTQRYADNWHPLTWLSHALDYRLYGLSPGGHHATNVALHAMSAVLLFLLLRRATASFWPSVFVAAVFAVHPLKVESVAWVAERKDVLSGVFFMLTLAAYVYYARRPFSVLRYLAVFAMLALGLLAKPMLVTLPLVLLLLDYWPLNRFPPAETAMANPERLPWIAAGRLAVEKLPLLALAAAAAVMTLWAQGEAVQDNAHLSLSIRITNAIVAYVVYVGQSLWPEGLAVFYPLQAQGPSAWELGAASLILAAVSVLVFLGRRRFPYLPVGWLWYLGMLVPVIGLVQVGAQARADRYMYLPQIGLSIAVVWLVADLTARLPYRRTVCGAAAAMVLVGLISCTWRQMGYWRNSETLFVRALQCAPDSAIIHNNYGIILRDRGREAEAIAHFQEALRIDADCAEAFINLGNICFDQAKFNEAIAFYRKALAVKPHYAFPYANLGNAYLQLEKLNEAVESYQSALEIDPLNDTAHNGLGAALIRLGRSDEAMEHFRRAIAISPASIEPRRNLGAALVLQGKLTEAITTYNEALAIDPASADVRLNLGIALWETGKPEPAIAHWQALLKASPRHLEGLCWMAWARATCPDGNLRDPDEAVRAAELAVELSDESDPSCLDALAAAYAEANQFPEAVATAQKSINVATNSGNTALAEEIRKRLELYKAGSPYRERWPAEQIPSSDR